MKKTIFRLIFLLNLFVPFNIFCQEEQTSKIQVGCNFGVSSIPFAALKYVCEDKDYFSCNVNFYKTQKELISDFINNKNQIVFLPYDVALSVMENFSNLVVCGGITQKSNVYLISSNEVKSFSDLLGKTVSIPKDDKIAQNMFKWICSQYDIQINKGLRGIILNDLDEMVDLVPKLANFSVRYGILSEPYASIATKKDRKNKIALDMQNEYDSVIGTFSVFPETVMLVQKSFSTTKEFLEFEELLHSVFDYILINPEKTAKWNAKYNLIGTDYIVRLSFFKLNFCFLNNFSIYEDFLLSAKIVMPDSEFVQKLNENNFCLFK